MTRYLTTDEVAEILRETPATVMRRCAAGLIPAAKIGNKWRIAETVIGEMLAPSNQGSAVRSTAGRRRAS
jgi:excisionase family DNA binding protein